MTPLPALVDWTSRLRGIFLRELQVLATLEKHRDSAPRDVRVRYAFPVSLGARRLRRLEETLRDRSARSALQGAGFARAAGRWIGWITGRGGRRRVLACDLEGLRRIEALYEAASRECPPREIVSMLAEFLAEVRAERCALLQELEPPPDAASDRPPPAR